jgi:hypothetical protein
VTTSDRMREHDQHSREHYQALTEAVREAGETHCFCYAPDEGPAEPRCPVCLALEIIGAALVRIKP